MEVLPTAKAAITVAEYDVLLVIQFRATSVALGGPASHVLARRFGEPDLTNVDLGVEADAAVDAKVEAPRLENDPIGIPGSFSPVVGALGGAGLLIDWEQRSLFAAPGAVSFDFDAPRAAIGGGTMLLGLDSNGLMSGNIGGGLLGTPGFNGRSGATKVKLLTSEGGNADSERAVALGLAWLAKQQRPDGSWEFDGGSKADRIAATGMCLLPFLAAGETHLTGKKYKTHVAKGLAYLRSQLKPNGQFGASGMYSQPIATMALCEAAGMTQDRALLNAGQAAVDYIVKAQSGNGSWGYTAGQEGDTSIVGWNIQALKSARLAGIAVPYKAFNQAAAFLNSVSNDSGASYGYRGPGASPNLSAVGLLCRQYMGWTPRNGKLGEGVDKLVSKYPPQRDDFNMYYYYYATQVVHFFGGKDWEVKWNPAMRKVLLDWQITENTANAKPVDLGSWPKDNHFIGSECGKLGTTAMAVLTLEVYYRHTPLYKRDVESK
jgi:hypothetical protein